MQGQAPRCAPSLAPKFWPSRGRRQTLTAPPSHAGQKTTIYGPTTTPIEQISLSTSTPTYMTYTAADDSWLTTNNAGDQTGYWRYDAYGNLATGTPTSPFGYSGQYADSTTGLVNDRARWYQTQTGGFTSRDPAFVETDTAYLYAGNDPVNMSDPTGLHEYSYWYGISWASPQVMLNYTWRNCSWLFPLSGSTDFFHAGEKMNLKEKFGLYTQSFPVMVTVVCDHFFQFISLPGHPDRTSAGCP